MKELIKQIRALTGAGFSECKKAAEESNGNLESALEILKKKGIERAAKKVGNEVEHGSVIIKRKENKIIVLNFRAQTDFAVKSDAFCSFVDNEANIFLNASEESLNQTVNDSNESYQDRLSFFISTLGENVVLSSEKKFIETEEQKYVYYLHNKVNSNFDNIALLGVVLAFNKEADDEICLKIVKHVAAADAIVLSENEITNEMKINNSDIENGVLLNQQFFYDNSVTIKELIEKNNIFIKDFNVFNS
ncbi:hypothetical protein [Alphaproteobacteria bacterium endosymbiont of Tiliacea citrago]|uniref:hypothetical protein n=1 Tax=Alphaproteobacteria bacterium endosymbiont of Tiliacea citrago TaxID=3077944 RepID=UPI00313CBA53